MIDETILAAIGDQPRMSEPRHSRRARFHQSWFRSARLGVSDWGETRGGRPLGSILSAAAADAGLNFSGTAARELFVSRHAQGWGVDPVRTPSVMTSSQTLALNFLGPLAGKPDWLLAVFNLVLGRTDLLGLLQWRVEHAIQERGSALNDMTRIDAYFEFQSARGIEAVVLEVKYADRFNSRQVEVATNPRYNQLAARSGLWRCPERVFQRRGLNQLLRVHALGAATLERSVGVLSPVTLLVVAHAADKSAGAVADGYRDELVDPSQALCVGLNALFSAMIRTAPSPECRQLASDLFDRYVDESLSEHYWDAFRFRTASGAPGGDAS